MVSSAVAVLVAGLAAAGLLYLAGRVLPASWRQQDDSEAVSHLSGLIRTFFTFVLAFVIVNIWTGHKAARDNTFTEANGLGGVYWAAHAMTGPDHQRIQVGLRRYVTVVINEEWAVMDAEHRVSQRAWSALDSVREHLLTMRPSDPHDQELRGQALSRIQEVYSARRIRSADASTGLPGFLWYSLLAGGVLMVCVPILAGTPRTGRALLMVGATGLLVTASLLLVNELDYAFSGGVRVTPEAFEVVQERFGQIS